MEQEQHHHIIALCKRTPIPSIFVILSLVVFIELLFKNKDIQQQKLVFRLRTEREKKKHCALARDF